MLARKVTTKGCLPGLEPNSWAPFLYQTNTILRGFTTGKRLSSDDPWSSESNDRRSDEGRLRRNPRNSRARNSAQRRPSNKSRPAAEPNERMRPIPFEGKVPSAYRGVRVEGSTMTPRELKIFEELFKAQQVQPEAKEGDKKKRQRNTSKGYKPESKSYGAVAPVTGREFPDLLRPLAEEAAALRARAAMEDDAGTQEDGTSSGTQQHEASSKELDSIKSEMDNAQTDTALWAVLQDRVFKTIRQLPESSNPTQSGHDFQILTQILPQSLLHFMKSIRSSFPGSSLGLVLLPTLKKLGPSAFALGASTELFNEHMWLLYQHYADLDGVAETLSEMDKNVYEFDAGTKDLINTILKDGHRARVNAYGPGMQALWSTDRKTRGLEKLRRWDGIVEERLKAAALRAAREEETKFSEEDEEEEQGRMNAS